MLDFLLNVIYISHNNEFILINSYRAEFLPRKVERLYNEKNNIVLVLIYLLDINFDFNLNLRFVLSKSLFIDVKFYV